MIMIKIMGKPFTRINENQKNDKKSNLKIKKKINVSTFHGIYYIAAPIVLIYVTWQSPHTCDPVTVGQLRLRDSWELHRQKWYGLMQHKIDGLEKDCSNSSALAM